MSEKISACCVLLLAVDAKIFNLLQRDGLVFRRALVGWLVALGVSAEGSEVDLPGRNSPYGINLYKTDV